VPGRFDYVKYDESANYRQTVAKKLVTDLEKFMNDTFTSKESGRAKALALTKLEEVYMWIGKGIRDDQIARNGSAPLQEERNDE
jgi:hypothetical protein